jgi:hypothetical protein
MGAFSLWHWLIVLVFLGVPVLAVAAVLLFLQQRERAKKNK